MAFEKEEGSLVRIMNGLGVGYADTLYVSSDIKTFLFNLATRYGIKTKDERNAALHELIDEFQKIVGDEGTLMFPVFSWDWCRGARV